MLSASQMRRSIAENVALVCLALWTGCGEEAPKLDVSPDLNGGVGGSGDAPAGGAAALPAAGAMATSGGSSGSTTTPDPAGQGGGGAGAGGTAGMPSECTAGVSGASNPQPGAGPGLDVLLVPHLSGDAVDYVDVTLTIEAPNVGANAPLLRLPMVFAGVESARYQSADIQVEDGMGTVPLAQVDDPVDPTNFRYDRHWLAGRATTGDVTVRYRAVTRAFIPVLGSGPPFDLRAEGGGLAGAGVSFLALPEGTAVYRITLRWDFAAMPANARGVFSQGEGDVELTGPVDLLSYAFYLAGPVSSYPECPGGPFQAFWLSQPPFDVQSVAQWTEQAYREISTFFRDADKPYRVFFRHNEAGAIGGAALSGSFMVGYGDAPAPEPDRLRAMLAHEIVHNWPRPLTGAASEWYGEGMAEHYSAAITLRAGLISPDELLAGLNARALSYYANPLRELPSSEIAARFWSDTRVRKIPYDRGAFYLASVDAAVRARSAGARTLDDLLFTMLDRLRAGQSYNGAAWSQLVEGELGAEGPAQYEAMLAGELLEPPGDAFGPCFSNEATTYPQFELGFDAAVLSQVPRIVTTVVAGSNAEQAGLRPGDEITAPVILDDVLTDPEAALTLELSRDNNAMAITYVPRGAEVNGYRWIRVPQVTDSECAL